MTSSQFDQTQVTAYYKAAICDHCFLIHTSAGPCYLIPPIGGAPSNADFCAFDSFILNGLISSYRYIDSKPQAVFLAIA